MDGEDVRHLDEKSWLGFRVEIVELVDVVMFFCGRNGDDYRQVSKSTRLAHSWIWADTYRDSTSPRSDRQTPVHTS